MFDFIRHGIDMRLMRTMCMHDDQSRALSSENRIRNRGGCFWLCNAACGANEITRQASSAEVAWTDFLHA